MSAAGLNVPPLVLPLPPSLHAVFAALEGLTLVSTADDLHAGLHEVARRALSLDDFERAFVRARAHEIAHCHSPANAEEHVNEAFEPIDHGVHAAESASEPHAGIGTMALRLLRCLLGCVAVRAPWIPGIANLAMELAWRVEQVERAARDRAWAREWQREAQP